MFWDAINDIEDRMAVISMDVDLLDRAERRDLPTAHQELIARARATESTTDCTTDMDFSDMDNFMNWNTSSSFENFDECAERVRRRKSTTVGRKPSDKVEDDVVNRICRDNNRTVPDPVNPISKVGHSRVINVYTFASNGMLHRYILTGEPQLPPPLPSAN